METPAAIGVVPGAARSLPAPESPRPAFSWWLRAGLIPIVVALLYVTLRKVSIPDIVRVLSSLQISQLALLLAVDALIFVLITARWWLVVRSENMRVRFLPMIAVRLSVFGVSYFTFGPQIGGEPLQVLYLRREHGSSYTRAAASVLIDKLFELLGNFVLLCFGLAAIVRSGILSGWIESSGIPIILLGLLISWPLAHIVLLCCHVYPISALLDALGLNRRNHRKARFIRASERLAGQFCQRHPRTMLGVLLISLLAAAATVSEYALITSFLEIRLPFWALVTAWTGGWLSFLAPLPGGLGTLEASQVWTLGFFGVTAAAAISITLVIRGRDLLIGGVGLLIAGHAAWKAGNPSH